MLRDVGTGLRAVILLLPLPIDEDDDAGVDAPREMRDVSLLLPDDELFDELLELARSARVLLGVVDERVTLSLLDVFRSLVVALGVLLERDTRSLVLLVDRLEELCGLDGLRSARSPDPVSRAMPVSYGVTVTVPTAPVALSDPTHISSSRTTVSTPALENTMPGDKP